MENKLKDSEKELLMSTLIAINRSIQVYKSCDPCHQSFTWTDFDNNVVDVKIINEFECFTMYSTYNHPMIVKPTMKDLVEYFPKELFGKVNAIMVVGADIDYNKGIHEIIVKPLYVKLIKKDSENPSKS